MNHNNEYEVNATVVFQENQSKAQVVYPYELTLVKEENRWLFTFVLIINKTLKWEVV